MLVNNSVTIYHKGFDALLRHEVWTRYYYDKVWFFGGKGAGLNKGYTDANNVDVRLSYKLNNDLDINNFAIGDIIVEGNVNLEIISQKDLSNYNTYNITSINNNIFGRNPHIHLGGK